MEVLPRNLLIQVVAIIIIVIGATVASFEIHEASIEVDEVRTIIVRVSDRPLVKEVGQFYSESLIEEKMSEVTSYLETLRLNGIEFEVKEILVYSIHGVVLDIQESSFEEIERISGSMYLEFDSYASLNLAEASRWIGYEDVIKFSELYDEDLNGEGVVVALIDTGIDYTNPNLGGGFGPTFKVIGGEDLLTGSDDPLDLDGHGTHIAGIIAGDGLVNGIAPGAKLLAYRIVSTGNTVPTSFILRAIDSAVGEGADVINLSLGGLVGGRLIREAIANAVEAGVVIVAASGNSGPGLSTISYPAAAREAIAVGATRNNVSQSLAVDLRLDPKVVKIEVIPMRQTHVLDEVSGPLVFVNFARPQDVAGVDLDGAIAIAVRGGERGELVYFADKEDIVAKMGAKALIVYNNLPGPFIGTLLHPSRPEYSAAIPVVSMPRDQGEAIRTALSRGPINATLRFLLNPDSVDAYSSRGPSSPFFIKPDIVAPGSFINSTWIEGKTRVLSGTSFAAPFVTGTAALLKQLHPDLDPGSIASVLKLSSTILRSRDGEIVSVFDQGAGRLNLSSAILTPIVVKPHNLVIHLSPNKNESTKLLSLSSLVPEAIKVKITTSSESGTLDLRVLNQTVTIFPNASLNIGIRVSLSESEFGPHQGFIYLETDLLKLSLPIVVYYNNATVIAEKSDGSYSLSLITLGDIHSGRIMILTPDNRNKIIDLSEGESIVTFTPSKVGRYFVNAELRTSEGLELGRTAFDVESASELPVPTMVPMRAILIAAVWLILGAILAVTLFIFRKESYDLSPVQG